MEEENSFNLYAVAIKKGSKVIGHVPCKISAACFLSEMSETSTCEITDSNHQYLYDLPQGGMQLPCKLIFISHNSMKMMKIKWLIQTVPPRELECKQAAPSKRRLDSESSHNPSSKKKALKIKQSYLL